MHRLEKILLLALLILAVFSDHTLVSSKTVATKKAVVKKPAAAVKKPKSKSSDETVPIKISLRDVGGTIRRIPVAAIGALKASTKSFISSSAVLIPVGLVMNINKPRPIDAWIMRGAATGIEWAKIGAYFVGGEVMFANLRNKDDRINAYLGSGLTSGLLRMDEGPLGIAQGFAIGYGFMYAIDKFIVDDPAAHNLKTSGSKSKK